MNELSQAALFKVTKVTHWTARILSLVLLVSWGSVLNSLPAGDSGIPVGLVVIAMWLLGLAVAWEYEFVGALTVIGGSFLSLIAAPQLFPSPVILVTSTALLFLTSHLMRRTLREDVIQQGLSL